MVFGEHGQDVGGVKAVEIVNEESAFTHPLTVELAPGRFGPAGIEDGEMQTVGVDAVPVFGGDELT